MLHSSRLNTWLKPLGIFIAFCLLSNTHAQDTAAPSSEPTPTSILDAYPQPEPGYKRHVIHLPIGNYENDLKIELLAGKVQEVDCNPAHFVGIIKEKILEGWGYNYYELSDLQGPISTKMACPDEPLSLRFVPVQSNGSLLQYNSNLPVVVYLPDGLELRWRTWVATPYNTAFSE